MLQLFVEFALRVIIDVFGFDGVIVPVGGSPSPSPSPSQAGLLGSLVFYMLLGSDGSAIDHVFSHWFGF